MRSDTEPTDRDREMAADACYSGKYDCVGDRVAELIAAAREEGRQEGLRQERCSACLAYLRLSGGTSTQGK